MMVINGFNFVTKEKIVDAGPIQIDKKVNHPIAWSPIAGGILLVSGLAILIVSKKKA